MYQFQIGAIPFYDSTKGKPSQPQSTFTKYFLEATSSKDLDEAEKLKENSEVNQMHGDYKPSNPIFKEFALNYLAISLKT